jgi:outer membrane protein assembly factor BamB
LYALDAKTGKAYWDYTTGGVIDSSPAVIDDVVYVGSQDHTFYALNTQTGEKLWSYTTGGPIVSSPTIANDVIYIGSNDRSLYAFSLISISSAAKQQ